MELPTVTHVCVDVALNSAARTMVKGIKSGTAQERGRLVHIAGVLRNSCGTTTTISKFQTGTTLRCRSIPSKRIGSLGPRGAPTHVNGHFLSNRASWSGWLMVVSTKRSSSSSRLGCLAVSPRGWWQLASPQWSPTNTICPVGCLPSSLSDVPIAPTVTRVWVDFTFKSVARPIVKRIQRGDFNVKLSEEEKAGGAPFNPSEALGFRHTLDACNLIDLGSNGPPFTWRAVVRVLPMIKLDHHSTLVDLQGGRLGNPHKRPFRYLATWQTHRDFPELMCSSWSDDVDLVGNLVSFRVRVQVWNEETFSNILFWKSRALARLAGIQRAIQRSPNPHLERLEREVSGELEQRRRMKIESLRAPDGEWVIDAEVLRDMVVAHFRNLYGDSPSGGSLYTTANFSVLPQEVETFLMAAVEGAELRRVLFVMRPFKASGPDDFQATLRRVIMDCVTTTTMQVLWNGATTEEFIPKRVHGQVQKSLPGCGGLCSESSQWLVGFSFINGGPNYIAPIGIAGYSYVHDAGICTAWNSVRHGMAWQLWGGQRIRDCKEEDVPYWRLDSSGDYSVKTTYQLLTADSFISPPSRVWRVIWSWEGPRRLRAFLWLVARESLLTNEARVRRRLEAVDGSKRTWIFIHWVKPLEDFMKLNTDGAVRGSQGVARAGGILRNSSVGWIIGFMQSLGVSTVMVAELWGVLTGLELAWNVGCRRLILEIDSMVVLTLISRQDPCPPCFFRCRRAFDIYCRGIGRFASNTRIRNRILARIGCRKG
ncbi:hypothetical protein CRG98_037905 [Punica granatum]|uniref:RNase H type-1 domain-containing protein n=1 Tax=Punica granatum TaxID=22663 RepID=A0A2I0ID11_PUNGR|nr:hypothetical protein CRG98_037905 [Punica granatum]